jgi:O-methyltransferase
VKHYEALGPYVTRIGNRKSAAQKEVLERIWKHEFSRMSGTEDEANFLALMCKIAGYKRIIEVGTFLGFTTLVLAESLPEDGRIITLDIGEEFLAEAKQV